MFRRLTLCLLLCAPTLWICAQNAFDVTAEAWRCLERQQPDSAVALAQQAVQLFETNFGKDHPQVGVGYKNLAGISSQAGHTQDAIRYCLKAMDIEREAFGEDDDAYAELMLALARYYGDDRQFQKSIEWGERALAYYEDAFPQHLRDLGAAQSNLTWAYADAGDYTRAISMCKQAEQTWIEELGEGHAYIAILQNNLADYYARLGDFKQAVHYDQRCLDVISLYTSTPDTLYATALSNMASHYAAAGQNTQAIETGQKAVLLRRQLLGEHDPHYLKSVGDLAATYARINELNEAIRIQEYVLSKHQEAGDTVGLRYIRPLGNLAMLKGTQGHLDEAIRLTRQALDVARRDDVDSELPLLTSNLALYYGTQKDYDHAIDISRQTLHLYEKKGRKQSAEYARLLSDLSVWYNQKGDTKKAVQNASRAIAIYEKIFGAGATATLTSRHNLATYYADQQRWTDAMNTLLPAADKVTAIMRENFTGLSAQQRSHYWAKYSTYLTNLLPRYMLHSGSTQHTGQLYDQSALFAKSLLLNTELEMTRLIFESGDSALVDQYYEIQDLKADLEKLRALPRAERTADADSLQLDISRREARLALASKAYGDYCQSLNVTWQQVRDQLHEGEMAVEFLSFPDDTTLTYAALTLKPGYEQPRLTAICTEADLLALNAAGYNLNPQERNVALCHTVWRPLADEMQGVRRIYFSPAGRLYQIGIEQLPWDSVSIASDHYDFYRLSSTRELCHHSDTPDTPAAEAIRRAILYGGLAYDIILDDEPATKEPPVQTQTEESIDRGLVKKLNKHLFSYLKNTQVEVDAISDELSSRDIDCTLLTNEEGTEQTFKQLSGQGYQLLHVATHGQFVPYDQAEKARQQLNLRFMQSANDSGIALVEDVSLTHSLLAMSGANTLLNRLSRTLDADRPDVSNAALQKGDGVLTASEISRIDLRGMDLVVLSACQTGLGDVTSEGVMGLQRGFKKAGVQTILMSLWSVDDRATAQLMVSFYHNLMQGQTKRQAFLAAQNDLRQRYAKRPNAERLWGAFILLDALD